MPVQIFNMSSGLASKGNLAANLKGEGIYQFAAASGLAYRASKAALCMGAHLSYAALLKLSRRALDWLLLWRVFSSAVLSIKTVAVESLCHSTSRDVVLAITVRDVLVVRQRRYDLGLNSTLPCRDAVAGS